MVFYFTSDVVSPPVKLFMGIDKYEISDAGIVKSIGENEASRQRKPSPIGDTSPTYFPKPNFLRVQDPVTSKMYLPDEHLIKYGWPEDVWFHVDNVSSAHVYLRLKKGETLDDINENVLMDACQLVKANSIQGNKMNNLDIVYTTWDNLKKTPSMEVGQVSFHQPKLVRKIRVEKRINEIVNRLNKTKIEAHPDFQAEREARDAAERQDKKKVLREQKDKEKDAMKKRQEEAELKSYASLHKPENMTNTNFDNNDSDDFM